MWKREREKERDGGKRREGGRGWGREEGRKKGREGRGRYSLFNIISSICSLKK